MTGSNRGRGSRKRSTTGNSVPSFSGQTGVNKQAEVKINIEEYEQVEDEYGFKYMRKRQKNNNNNSNNNSTAAAAFDTTPGNSSKLPLSVIYQQSPSTPTPTKQLLENNRRKRRSSFAVLAAANHQQARRNSSMNMSVSLTQNLPPFTVDSSDYSKHLVEDLPGPVKMRQLMVWACQKAHLDLTKSTGLDSKSADLLSDLADGLVQGLFKNEINTSWYQRPAAMTFDENWQAGGNRSIPNPQNQETAECIDLYKTYQEQLKRELRMWDSLEQQQQQQEKTGYFNIDGTVELEREDVELFAALDEQENRFNNQVNQLGKWISNLPLSMDRFDWTMQVTSTFQDHSRDFCESVFHQIFAKYFAGDLSDPNRERVEPMMVLRALSRPVTGGNILGSPGQFAK